MRGCYFVVLLLMSSSCFAEEACLDGPTQSDMNECTATRAQSADAELNEVYRQVLDQYASDQNIVDALREAQRAWLVFRDAQMKAIFPGPNRIEAYGSVFPMCHAMLLEEVTRERTKQLRVWLDGVEEGEVCAGSVRVR